MLKFSLTAEQECCCVESHPCVMLTDGLQAATIFSKMATVNAPLMEYPF